MRIVFDNNIWISFLIGKRLSELRSVFGKADITIYYCDELEKEFLEVANRPKISKYVDEAQVDRVHRLMTDFCVHVSITSKGLVLERDPKDEYLLDLSDSVNADILVSGDSDLTDLCEHHCTKILSFKDAIAVFNEYLKRKSH
jgi:putative PIN family toxin of toxin-antitoxin system